MSIDLKELQYKKTPIRGMAEIVDENGNVIRKVDNLILASTRLAILYNLFKDSKILETARSNGYLPTSTDSTKKSYIPTICGFMFGCNGTNISNPSILRVPSPVDKYSDRTALDNNSTNFIPVPIISVTSSGDLLNTSGSYQNISEFLNNPVISPDQTIITTNNTVQYFTPSDIDDQQNYYCKAIDTSNSEIKINEENFEIEYIAKFNIKTYDLVGKSFNEIGLVLANCEISDSNIITDIDTSTVSLASRLTFEEVSLSTQLLSSFIIRYHIYI